MLWSRFYIPTLKEAPSDAEVISHKLMTRAGMIRKITSGIYTYMPYGSIAINKVAQIVREEMNRAGAIELTLPMVQPADLWQESGRWEQYGKELLRFHDRHDREYCLGPTHEEIITDLMRGEVRSYRQLPINLYQIQTKFRDEVRPRFGLMRGREFLMKDAYSFDRDNAGADISYKAMYDAYMRIFTRLGLKFKAVEADSGSIGGSFSHEFMVLAQTGEDTIASCTKCNYAANLERAQTVASGKKASGTAPALAEIATPNVKTIEEVAAFLKINANDLIKTLLFEVDGKVIAALVRGDREINEVKIKNYFNADSVELLAPEKVEAVSGAPVGFAGPAGLKVETIVADFELEERNDWVAGANKTDTHVKNLDLTRDAKIAAYIDLRNVTAQDLCPRCGSALELPRGIEVGHVFKLGTKYSEAMKATFLDENGKEQTMIMGCYGIGVTRVVAACIEQNNDENGIIFPPAIAPFTVEILNLDIKSDEVNAKAQEIHDYIESTGFSALLDDRDERPGVKFKDADLIGAPMQIIIGSKGLQRGVVEVKNRKTGEKGELAVADFTVAFEGWKNTVLEGWKI
ncbi:proline--tRNA ligase [Desulfovibrio sp. OttesenSCG-928-F07]|nr:proline--tRNA ligase [Desulfovibrio sp. OttesenSCG-928-F07]